MVRELNSKEFENEVLNSKDMVLVDFSAIWCGPCKMLAHVVEQLGREMKGKAKVVKVDVDKSRDIAERYNITSLPTIIMFKNGVAIDKMVGFQPKNVLRNKLGKYL